MTLSTRQHLGQGHPLVEETLAAIERKVTWSNGCWAADRHVTRKRHGGHGLNCSPPMGLQEEDDVWVGGGHLHSWSMFCCNITPCSPQVVLLCSYFMLLLRMNKTRFQELIFMEVQSRQNADVRSVPQTISHIYIYNVTAHLSYPVITKPGWYEYVGKTSS